MKKRKKINPAAYVIKQFGGIRQTSRAVKRAPSAILGWERRKCIPLKACPAVLSAAKKQNLNITAEILIFGK